ncbi:MAG: pilus assembly protein PilM [Candidatus Pelagibacter sp.]
MDDKEKEKFGVIIDKNDQDKNDQPKVESDNKNVETEQVQETNIKSDEEKQPEIDNSTENSENSSNENNLAENNEDQIKNETTADDKITENADEKKEHQVIHKKDGRLHIYVRQDKYKGELKSKNWVGRLYIDGKQKISSSGTPNLEEAIPILEKWFDDVHAEKEKEQNQPEQSSSENVINDATPENLEKTTAEVIPNETNLSNPQEAIVKENLTEKITETKQETQDNISINQTEVSNDEEQSKVKNIFNKLKNIKFKAPSFGKQNTSSPKLNFDKNKVKEKFNNFIKSKLGKKTAQGEEIVGVEITGKEIRLTQISSNKANQWVLEKFYVHPIDLPDDAAIIEHEKKVSEELNVALQKSKISTPNAAIAIPVTNAIIRVVTAPLMNDEELKKAIDTNSLWENLVQLTDNLDDYSIFHQVINRNSKDNTMDILFVASKLADINNYTNIIKNSGLNPVIIDVKCFALKSAVDQINQISNKTEDTNFTAMLEFGLDENYVMILYNNNPIITDIFLRGQDRKILKESQDQEEKDALVRRFMTQVKQAVQDFETKYEKRVRNIKVVSNLPNVDDYLSSFRKSLVNTGFNLFDPFEGLNIPQQLESKINLTNRSYFSTTVGLAFRKLDVFGYYKFVTAVKNINLLPNREGMIKQKKMKAFSDFAYKGLVGAFAGIYLILFALSFWNIYSYNNKLKVYDAVVAEHTSKTNQLAKVTKELKKMTATLKLSNSLKSNKDLSYRVLAQIATSVPNRVKFDSVEYDGKRQVVITGIAAGDNDILALIRNLQSKNLITQASLSSMKMPKVKAGDQTMKGFRVFVKVKG